MITVCTLHFGYVLLNICFSRVYMFLCVCPSMCISPCVLWSLEFGAGVFHDFLLIKFGGTEQMQRRNLAAQQVGWQPRNPGRNKPQ